MVGKNLSHYHITAELGRGGMGIVYRATDTKLDRTVAIKVLPPAALASEDDRERFFREAQAAAKLSHPNVCHVYQVDEAYPAEEGKDPHPDAEKRLFIAMEFIDGETLHDIVKKGPLKLREAVRITTQVADALKAAHGKGIVHRDIKSANVMLTDEGIAKVLDFGLAKTSESTMLTRLGSTLGTIHYMSPEQARGEDVDSRSDLYSVGTMLFEMIVGRTPFAGEYEQAVIYSILNEDPEPVTALRTGVPMQLEWIINKLLAKDPGRRYQTAADLIADLSGVDTSSASQTSVSATSQVASASGSIATATVIATAAPAVSKTRPVWQTLAALVVGLLIGAAAMMLRPGAEPEIKTVKRFELRFPGTAGEQKRMAISPDGSRLAIWDLADQQLLIKDLQTGSTVENEIPGIFTVSFSGDNQQILISTVSGIQKGRIDGSNLIAVTDQTRLQVGIWLSGDRIMTSSLGPFVVVVPPVGQPDTVRSETGNMMFPFQELTNGKVLFGSIDAGGKEESYLLDMTSGTQTRLLVDFEHVLSSGHAISDSDDGKILVTPVDMESLEPLGPAMPLPYLDDSEFTVATDGTMVYHEINQSDNLYEIRVRRRDGTDEQILGEAVTGYFRLSPDRHHVLFNKSSESDEGITTVLDVRSELETQIANGTNIASAVWNNDGTEIYGFQDKHIVVTPSDRSEPPQQLKAVLAGIGELEWVSDGSGLVYSGVETTSNFEFGIALYNIDTDSTEWLVEPDGFNTGPKLSRDDRYLSFQIFGDDPNTTPPMTILELETGNTWRLPLENGAFVIQWAASGNAIEYQKGDSLMSIPIQTDGGFRATGRPEVVEIIKGLGDVYRTAEGDIYYSREIVDPDEKASKEDDEAVYHVVINWFEELKQIAPTGQ